MVMNTVDKQYQRSAGAAAHHAAASDGDARSAGVVGGENLLSWRRHNVRAVGQLLHALAAQAVEHGEPVLRGRDDVDARRRQRSGHGQERQRAAGGRAAALHYEAHLVLRNQQCKHYLRHLVGGVNAVHTCSLCKSVMMMTQSRKCDSVHSSSLT